MMKYEKSMNDHFHNSYFIIHHFLPAAEVDLHVIKQGGNRCNGGNNVSAGCPF